MAVDTTERVAQSRRALTGAVIDLLRTSPAGRITITEVCRQANVTRPTFYQHYASLDDLVGQAVAERLREHQQAALALDADAPDTDLQVSLGRFLDRIWGDRNLVRALRNTGAAPAITHHASVDVLAERILARLPGPHAAQTQLRARFAAAGITELLADWLDSEDPARVRDTYARLLRDLTAAVVSPAE